MNPLPEKYRHDLQIIRETAAQIKRDLMLQENDIVLSGDANTAFDELITQLIPVVGKMYRKNRQAFFAMLYRVDIHERDFRKSLEKSEELGFEEQISGQIIRRSFQKVITRKYFSENQSTNNPNK